MATRTTGRAMDRTRHGSVLWNRATIGAVLLVTLLAAVRVQAQSPQQVTGEEPSQVVTTFYKWVIGTMVTKRSPLRQKRVMATWLSKSLYRWLYTKADREERETYLVPGNDFIDAWVDEIEIVDSKVLAKRAVLKVDLGKPGKADDFVNPLLVNLKMEDGVWKIDCVRSNEDDTEDAYMFDPALDPPGCKPVR